MSTKTLLGKGGGGNEAPKKSLTIACWESKLVTTRPVFRRLIHSARQLWVPCRSNHILHAQLKEEFSITQPQENATENYLFFGLQSFFQCLRRDCFSWAKSTTQASVPPHQTTGELRKTSATLTSTLHIFPSSSPFREFNFSPQENQFSDDPL